MTAREEEILQKAKAAILSVEPRAEVILYGSRARGEAHEESDFDLMILTPEKVRVLERRPYYSGTNDICLDYGELLSLRFETREVFVQNREWHPFLSQVHKDGIVIA